MKIYKKITITFLLAVIISFSLNVVDVCASDKSTQKKEEKLKDKKKDVKKTIQEVKKEKEQLQKKLNSQYVDLSVKKKKISQTEYQVQAKEEMIKENEKEIKQLEKEQDFQKTALKAILRKLYYTKKVSNIHLFNAKETRFFSKSDDYDALRDKANKIYRDLEKIKEKKEDIKEETLNAKQEKEKLLLEQKKQHDEIKKEAIHTQIEVKRADATLTQLNAKLASIESSLSALLGGSFDTKDIVKAAKFASKKTGVRKDFILGMLTQETSLGRFTGGCTYKQSKMGKRNAKIFKRITKDLGYNYKKKKVSCPLSYGIGGAMGVAQFMPSTWVHYEEDVTRYTGHDPADPWSLTDGVMAMAIKLKRDGGDDEDGEYDAARRYYCGANINRKVCRKYASSVLYWSDNYKRLLK